MKNLVTITGAPAAKGEVIKEVAWQLTKSLTALVVNKIIFHNIVKAMLK